jgi:hypothetical protein
MGRDLSTWGVCPILLEVLMDAIIFYLVHNYSCVVGNYSLCSDLSE